MDKLLSPLIILAMVGGTLLSQFVPGVQEAFDTATIRGVSARTRTIEGLMYTY